MRKSSDPQQPTKPITVISAMNSPSLFGQTFKRGLLRGDSWKIWRVLLKGLYGLPMTREEAETWRKYTGGRDVPTTPFEQTYLICGRRSGKSQISAMLGVYISCFRDYSPFLTPGERAVLPIICPDRKQCQIVLSYISGFFDSSPTLASLVKVRLKESIELTNGVFIEVHTASFRAVRGYTAIGAIVDELAFLRSEDSTNPDVELIQALLPAMSTIPGALLLGISSPYARRGFLWQTYKENFGKSDSPILVWQAETTAMNPSVNKLTIAAAYARDRAAASAEYGAQFRSDIESFLDVEIIESRVIRDRHELPFLSAYSYVGFCDPSGGQHDSFCLAVAHCDTTGLTVLDCVREVVPPFSPESVCQEFAVVLKSYGISEVTGDRYAGEWPREQFRKYGIEYRVSERTKSEIYLSFLPALMSGQVELLDNQRLIAQLVGLERRTARGGRDSVDHSPGSHDDVANSACGALTVAAGPQLSYGWIEYVKGLESGQYKMPPAPTPEVLRVGNETRSDGSTAWNQLAPPPCPECKSSCAWVGGGGARCVQCGKQFWPDGKPAAQYGGNRTNCRQYNKRLTLR